MVLLSAIFTAENRRTWRTSETALHSLLSSAVRKRSGMLQSSPVQSLTSSIERSFCLSLSDGIQLKSTD